MEEPAPPPPAIARRDSEVEMRDLVWFWFGGFDLIWEEGGGSTRGEKGIFGFERRMETPPPLRPGLGFKFPLLFFFFNQISYSGFFYIVVFADFFSVFLGLLGWNSGHV